MSKIVVSRPKEWINRRRAYKLKLDDQDLGEIKNDQILEFEVAPGRHSLRAIVDWTSSNTWDMEIAEGETHYIRLSAFKHANWLMPSGSILIMLYVIVLRRTFQLGNTIWEKIYWGILILYVGVFAFYLTLGRKRYLWLRTDIK